MVDSSRAGEETDQAMDNSADVMAAIDDSGADSRFVIADVSRDGSWLAATTDVSVSIAEVR